MPYFEILVPGVFQKTFTYFYDNPLEKGSFVKIPFRRKSLWGIVLSQTFNTPSFETKSIEEVSILPTFSPSFMEFCLHFSSYTLTPLGGVAKMMLPPSKILENSYKAKKELSINDFEDLLPPLNEEQEEVSKAVDRALDQGNFKPFLLKGVTGSGKTEVYFKSALKALSLGKQVLILLPEIGLTTAFVKRFEERFKVTTCVWHSDVLQSQKNQIWKGCLEGKVRLVLGTRSSLFLPFKELGLIVVDEEHDSSYKQEEQVLYHARDMAVLRAKYESAIILLCSATPSFESLKNAEKGRYELLILSKRHGTAVLPTVKLLDAKTKEKGNWITPALRGMIFEKLEKKEQVFLFLNRKGYAPLTLCNDCGHRFMCPGCSFWLVHHKKTNKLHCHYCGFEQFLPKSCPTCEKEDSLVPVGPGVERIYEEVKTLFPTARAEMITKETFEHTDRIHQTLDKIYNNEIDILVGTQILAKGYHFPNLTLVGIIDADVGLSGGDFRASEKTFQLLHQVSGRSGRESKQGIVAIQTHLPEHPLMQALEHQDFEEFMTQELESRLFYHMPPFGKMVSILLTSLNQEEAYRASLILAKTFHHYFKDPSINLLGPTPAALFKLKSRHRYKLLIHSQQPKLSLSKIRLWLFETKISSHVTIKVDVDPLTVL